MGNTRKASSRYPRYSKSVFLEALNQIGDVVDFVDLLSFVLSAYGGGRETGCAGPAKAEFLRSPLGAENSLYTELIHHECVAAHQRLLRG